ncbi:MAG: biliverdin-producing heme oxygenase [Cyanobacteria bacterium J06639_1]
MSHQLATQLREGTQEAHTMAENVGFIKGFLQGVVEKASYRKLVGNFYFVYKAMEEAFDEHREHPVLSPLYFPELWRTRTLERDLAYYYGNDWKSEVEMSPACAEYVDRIHQISKEQPELLVAHAYTRYMGDLSGGQILKNIAKRAMGLEDGSGLAFYDFEEISNPGPFKNQYREAMDGLPIADETATAIVKEANHSFHLNMKMFKELEGNWLKALFRLSWNSLLSRFKTSQRGSQSSPQAS